MNILPSLEEVKQIAATGEYNVLPVSCEILSDRRGAAKTQTCPAPSASVSPPRSRPALWRPSPTGPSSARPS